MVILKQHGQIGYIRLFKNCYTTSETKEDSEKFDLRITEPFESLQKFCDEYKFEELDEPEHKLIPFIVILIQSLNKWKELVVKNQPWFNSQHEGKGPQNYNEKTEFRALIKAGAKYLFDEEENFQEALNKVGNAFKIPGEIPDNVQDLFEKSENVDLGTSKETQFWVMVKALKDFREKRGCFPVS